MMAIPSHVKYIFLGKHNTLPIVISADLTEAQEKAFLSVLKGHREGIG